MPILLQDSFQQLIQDTADRREHTEDAQKPQPVVQVLPPDIQPVLLETFADITAKLLIFRTFAVR